MAALETSSESNVVGIHDHLIREANHRIANHLSLIVGMVHAQASALSNGPETISRGDARAMLQQTAGKIVSVGHLHRRLADQPHNHDIDVASYIVESCAATIDTLALRDRVGIVYELRAKCLFPAEKAQTLGLIANEIVMNAVKYAHPTEIPVQIHLVCDHAADNRIYLEIYDDGVGLPEGFDAESGGGVGFKLIRTLAKQLGAELSVTSDDLGTNFRVTLPA